MVTSVEGAALKNAIEKEAKGNAGFLYVQDQETIEQINEYYSNSEKTNGLRTTSSVDEPDVRARLDELTENRSYVTSVREDVYFLDPFKYPSDESSSLKNVLENVFQTKRYHTETSIINYLSEAKIRIAEDDLPWFIREMKARELLDEVGEDTTYYRPGEKLEENSELKPVESVLQEEVQKRDATTDGCLTVSEIGAALDIGTVDAQILEDLTEEEEALFDLQDVFLVNTDETIKSYVSQYVREGLSRQVEQKLKSNDWVMTTDRLETVIQREATTLLSAVDDEDGVFEDVKQEVIEVVGLEKEEIDIDNRRAIVYTVPDELDSLIEREASRIKSDVKDTIDNNNPPSMPTVMSNHAEFNAYGADNRVNTYVRKQVKAAAREQIDQDDTINVWDSIQSED
jgi:hypothetical protein